MKLTKLGDLAARVVGDGDATVVLLHGFGAPGDDLVPLAEMLADDLPGVRFVMPAAPLSLGAAYGFGRAWWHIDLARLERSILAGEARDMRNERPTGLDDARRAVHGLLDALDVRGQLVLGGFSQGAMLSVDAALRGSRALVGLALLSGTLLCVDEWKPLLPARRGLPVFQSHGTNDPLLPFHTAQDLRDLFAEAGIPVEWHAFEGAHEIPLEVLTALRAFLLTTLSVR